MDAVSSLPHPGLGKVWKDTTNAFPKVIEAREQWHVVKHTNTLFVFPA